MLTFALLAVDLLTILTQWEEEMEEVPNTLSLQSAVLSVALFAAPNDKMKDVLKRTVSEAKSATSKVTHAWHIVATKSCDRLTFESRCK